MIYSYTIFETDENENFIEQVGRSSDHRVTLKCLKGEQKCQQHTVEVLLDLKGSYYYFEVTLEGFDEQKLKLSYLQFNAFTGSPVYNVVQLVMRNTLCVLALLVLLIYLRRYFKISGLLRCWEQKMIISLLVGLIIFNNPFQSLMILSMTLLSYHLTTSSSSFQPEGSYRGQNDHFSLHHCGFPLLFPLCDMELGWQNPIRTKHNRLRLPEPLEGHSSPRISLALVSLNFFLRFYSLDLSSSLHFT